MAATSKKQRARTRKAIEQTTAYGNHDALAEATRLQRQLLETKLFRPTREELGLIPYILTKLSIEIRLMIYEYAFETPRGSRSGLSFADYDANTRRPIRSGVQSARRSEPRGIADARRFNGASGMAEPALLRACRTFRVEAMKLYCCFLSAEKRRLMESIAQKKAEENKTTDPWSGKWKVLASLFGDSDSDDSRLERVRKEKRRLRGSGLCLGVRRPTQDVGSTSMQEGYDSAVKGMEASALDCLDSIMPGLRGPDGFGEQVLSTLRTFMAGYRQGLDELDESS